MKKLLLYFLMFSSLFAFSQEPVDIYQRIKIYTGFEGLKTIASHGFDVDHGEVRPHIWFIGEFSETDVDKIRNLGFDIKDLIPDLKQHFLDNREYNYKDVK